MSGLIIALLQLAPFLHVCIGGRRLLMASLQCLGCGWGRVWRCLLPCPLVPPLSKPLGKCIAWVVPAHRVAMVMFLLRLNCLGSRQPLRHQLPSSSIGEEFKRSKCRSGKVKLKPMLPAVLLICASYLCGGCPWNLQGLLTCPWLLANIVDPCL